MSGKRNWGDNMSNRMDGKEPPPTFDLVLKTPSKVWRRKYECKKNKGDHTFEIALIKYAQWSQEKDGTWNKPQRGWIDADCQMPYWVEWHCSGCGKHDYEFRKLSKKFDRFRI